MLGILEFENSSKGSKNIYWQYETTEGNIEWQDEDTVKINNIELDVPDEKYDYRR
ncbi:DUF5412 family protein [Jeotgalibacillus aurantiacus]|uniref:DUF5412 family protein n=1 Tax=Jeotgalibacillus aurantiacus TaxID=2763266 RepID=UPI0029CAAFA3|nr:DUF5412 family protein [Jeotgalibacillus aurantiacus]